MPVPPPVRARIDPGRPLVIVPCGGRKVTAPSPAGDMYLGSYHRACRRAADALTGSPNILILSARYGLLQLHEWIEPYELRMGRPGSVTPYQLREQTAALGVGCHRPVVVLGGRAYVAAALAVWPDAVTPLAGVGGLGYQLRELTRIASAPALVRLDPG